jgi:hypothetical protein
MQSLQKNMNFLESTILDLHTDTDKQQNRIDTPPKTHLTKAGLGHLTGMKVTSYASSMVSK